MKVISAVRPSRVEGETRSPLNNRNTRVIRKVIRHFPTGAVVTVSQSWRPLQRRSHHSSCQSQPNAEGRRTRHRQCRWSPFVCLTSFAMTSKTSSTGVGSTIDRHSYVLRLRRTSVNPNLPSSRKRLHEVTHLKRAGPPRAGPGRALTKKTPVGAGVLWSSTYSRSDGNHTPRSDGTGQVSMICASHRSKGVDHSE